MRLTHLTLTAFRSFQKCALGTDAPRVVFAGVNGTGKTSCADAIRWVLTGACRGTDAKGAGAVTLIPEGTQAAEASVTIQGLGVVARKYAEGAGGFKVEGFTGTGQAQFQALYEHLGTTPAFMAAALDSSVFLDLTHVEAKALILSLLDVQIPIGSESVTLDELDRRYQRAFEDRRIAKKILAGVVLPAKPEGSFPAIPTIEAQLTKLRSERNGLDREVGSTIGQRVVLTQEISRLEAVLKTPLEPDVTEDLAAAKRRLAEAEKPKPGLFAANQVTEATNRTSSDPVARMAILRPTVQQLQNYTPTNFCVFDSGIPCKTPAKAFRDRLSELTAELKALDPKPAKPAQAPASDPLVALRREVMELENRLARRQATLEQAAQTEARLKAAKAELDALPNVAKQEQACAILVTRIDKGDVLLREARAHQAAVDAYQWSRADRTAKAAEVTRLEGLVEELGPNGVRVPALAAALGKFESATVRYLQPFGWTVQFRVDPWQVIVNGRPVETYSKSEQYRIGIALQLAIAQLSGLNFAIVDETDILDRENRTALTHLLLTAPVDQILILGTKEVQHPLPQLPGVLAYRLMREGAKSGIQETVGELSAA